MSVWKWFKLVGFEDCFLRVHSTLGNVHEVLVSALSPLSHSPLLVLLTYTVTHKLCSFHWKATSWNNS